MRISDWSSDVCSSDLFDCRSGARDLGIEHRLMPVIQGRRPDVYERCLDGLALDYGLPPLIGVGSMCRREVSGPAGLIAVFDHIARIMPKGVMFHYFGHKGTALSTLKGIETRHVSLSISEERRLWKECLSTFRSSL